MFKFKIILLIILTAASANILNAEPIDLSMDNGFAFFRFNDASASKVSVAGTFNEWNKNANFLSKNSEGIWELKLKLNEGSYEYKYVINDDNWVGADDGGNFVFSIISKDGKLDVKLPMAKAFKFPGGNTNLGNRIFIFGDYKFIQFFKKNERWRNEKPVHNIDLNVLINISADIHAAFQLNVLRSNNIKRQAGFNQGWIENSSKVDEGHITFKNEHIYIYGGRGERILDFTEPSKLLDAYAPNFQNGIYFYDDERTKYHKFGRDYNVIQFAKEFEKFNALIFYSDKQSSNEDLIGSRINSKFNKFNFGLTFLRSQDDDGAYGSPDGTNTEITENDTDGWIKHPRNYNDDWYHYDFLDKMSSDKNYKQNFSFDCSMSLTDLMKLYFQYVITQSRCAALVYNDGINDQIGGNASNPLALRRLMGEYFDEDKIVFGAVLQNKNFFKTGFELVSRDISSKENYTNVNQNASDISKKWYEINYKFKYFPNKNFDIGLNYSYQKSDDKNNVNYSVMFDDYNFRNFEIDGVSKIQKLHLNLNFVPADKFSFKFNDYFNTYNASNLTSEDMKTHEIKTQLSYKLTKKLSAFSGWRYKKYSIDDFSLTGKNLDDNFTNGNIGLKYNFSDVVYVKFSYGLGLFAEDEDKDIYFSNSLNEKFKENLKSRGAAYYDINAALDAEDYYEKTKFIVFEGTVTF